MNYRNGCNRPNGWKRALQVLAACVVAAVSGARVARAQTVPAWELRPPSQQQNTQQLFRDDFNTLDTNVWDVHDNSWNIQATIFGKTPSILSESGNAFARLGLDTYSPVQTGQRTLGSEIWSKAEYGMGQGVEFEARVRGTNVPRGLVFAFFTYRKRDFNADFDQEELDYEFLSNYINDPQRQTKLWLNIWNDYGVDKPTQPLVQGTDEQGLAQPTLNQNTWNTYTVRWLNDRVQWWVNDHLVRTETQLMPDNPMSLCFNIWQANSWAEAAHPSFTPTSDPAQNRNYYFDVDYVRVRQLSPDNSGVSGTGQGLTGNYFANPDFTSPQFASVSPRINYFWGTYSPDRTRLDNSDNTWSARWQGEIQAQFTENYTFSFLHDGRATLRIGNTTLINNVDYGNAQRISTGTINLVAGQRYPITLEYGHTGADAKVQLSWSSNSTPLQLVPQTQLYAPVVATPSFNPAGGTYYSAQNVTVSDSEVGAQIRYTLDGSEPKLTDAIITSGSFIRIDGTRRLRARAWKDGFVPSVIADATYTIIYDSQAPVVSVTSPADNQTLAALAQISGTFSESGGSGLASLTGRLTRNSDGRFWNGSTWISGAFNLNLAQNSGAWSLDVGALDSGTYAFRAFAADNAGNTAQSAAITFTLDKSAPTVSISEPVDTYSYRGLSQARGLAADSGSGVALVQMRLTRNSDNFNWDGRNWTADLVRVPALGTQNWTWDLPALSDGFYTLRAIAIDVAGNQTISAPAAFYLDNTKPTVTISSPATGATNLAPTLLSGTAQDAPPGVDVVKATLQRAVDNLYWNGTAWTADAFALSATGRDNWSLALPILEDGTYTAVVTARDFIGNEGTASVKWTLDRSGPAIAITAPAPNAQLPAGTWKNVSGTVSDASGVASVQVAIAVYGQYWNGATFANQITNFPATLNGETWRLEGNLPALSRPYVLTATATDVLGNISTSPVLQFTVLDAAPTPTPLPTVTPVPTVAPTPTPVPDRVAPTGNFAAPKNGDILRALPALRGQMADNAGGSGVTGALVTIQRFDGKTWSGNSWEADLQRVPALSDGHNWGYNTVPVGANLPDGLYRMAVWPFDKAGNRGLNIIGVRIDATPPQLAWASPSARESSLGQSLIYAVRAVDSNGLGAVEMAIQRASDGAYWNGREWSRALVRLQTAYGGAYWVLRAGGPPQSAFEAGEYQLLAIATDRAGNQTIARQALTLKADTSQPQFSGVRLSSVATRLADRATDLNFSGPLQIASLRDAATFRVRINGVDVEVIDKSYEATGNRLSLIVATEIPTGARVEVTWKGVRDTRGMLLADGYSAFAAS